MWNSALEDEWGFEMQIWKRLSLKHRTATIDNKDNKNTRSDQVLFYGLEYRGILSFPYSFIYPFIHLFIHTTYIC